VFFAAENLHYLIRLVGWRRLSDEWLIVLGIRNSVEVALCFIGVAIAHRFGFKRSAQELGLGAPAGRAFAFALIASLPMLVAFGLTFDLNPKMTLLGVAVGCFVAPFAEEVAFRGYMFRQLYRRVRLRFWIAVLLPAAMFAVVHIYQANNLRELLGVVAITVTGSIAFCWVFMRWQDNLWAPFGLHASMNLWWEMFAVDDTALGGWVANGARLITIVLAILMTLYKDRIWKPLPSEAENVRLGTQADAGGGGARASG
jgi:membrane protease YdiL (CAAX protease family)